MFGLLLLHRKRSPLKEHDFNVHDNTREIYDVHALRGKGIKNI